MERRGRKGKGWGGQEERDKGGEERNGGEGGERDDSGEERMRKKGEVRGDMGSWTAHNKLFYGISCNM